MDKRRHYELLKYIVFDFFIAMLTWALFYLYRKIAIEGLSFNINFLKDVKLLYGLAIIPSGWVLLYAIFDSYKDIYRLSRLSEITKTFFIALLGTIVLFFTLILDDVVNGDTSYYYESFVVLFSTHFLLTGLVRMILLTRASRLIKSGQVGFRTLVIGGNKNAVELYKEIAERPQKLGYFFQRLY